MKMRRTGYWDSHQQSVSVSGQKDGYQPSTVRNWQSAVGNRQPEPAGGEREVGKRGEGRMEGGRKLESISQARNRNSRLTVSYATGIPSMEEDLNSLIL